MDTAGPDSPLSSQPAWYKTTGGIVFLSFIGIVLALGIIFLSLLGFYLWKIKSGGGAELAAKFSDRFTFVGAESTAALGDTVDIAPRIRPENPVRGPKTAAVTIVSFIDFECPFCRASYPIFEDVVEKYDGVVRVVFKHFPITAIHPNAMNAANAAACAHLQGGFWPYYQALFATTDLSSASLEASAATAKLAAAPFANCVNQGKTQTVIDADIADAAALGIRGTPTYVVNGVRVEGVKTAAEWDTIILQALRSSTR